MNSKITKSAGAMALGILLLGTVSLSADSSATIDSSAAKQFAAAVQCEQQASQLQASIDEQTRLKAENIGQWRLHKSPPSRDITLADKKFEKTIADLRYTQSGWLELSHWHRLQAMELQTGGATVVGMVSN